MCLPSLAEKRLNLRARTEDIPRWWNFEQSFTSDEFSCAWCAEVNYPTVKKTWCAGQVWCRAGVAQARVEASRLGSALQRCTTVIIVGDVSSFNYYPCYRHCDHCDHCQYGKYKIRENLESSLFYKEYIWLRQPILGSQWNIVNSCFWGVWQLHGFPPDHIFIQTE